MIQFICISFAFHLRQSVKSELVRSIQLSDVKYSQLYWISEELAPQDVSALASTEKATGSPVLFQNLSNPFLLN